MKYILTLIITFAVGNAFAQDTTFYDYKWTKIKSLFGARYFEVTMKDSVNPSIIINRKYIRPSLLLEETPYSDYENKIIDGVYKKYYESGQLHISMPYKNGKIHGELITYWGDGELKRKDIYENGVFVSGKLTNTNKREIPYYPFIIEPAYKKGPEKMKEYLAKELHYPPGALSQNKSGTVIISAFVNSKGVLTEIKISKGVQEDLDQEALRVVQMMPRWKPRYVDGIPEGSLVFIPIDFIIK